LPTLVAARPGGEAVLAIPRCSYSLLRQSAQTTPNSLVDAERAFEYHGDALARTAIPLLRDSPGLSFALQNLGGFGADPLRVGTHQDVGPKLDGDRSFGVLTQRQARHSQSGRLLLEPPGVSEDQTRLGHQREKGQISHRLDQPQPIRRSSVPGKATFLHP